MKPVSESTPLLHSKWQTITYKWISLQCLCLIITIIIVSSILLKFDQPANSPASPFPDLPSNTISVNLKRFRMSALTPSIAHIGYQAINQSTFNYTNSDDYIHTNQSFADYQTFEKYGNSIQNGSNSINIGLFNMIQNISKWITKSTNRTISSFHSGWQFVASTDIEQPVISIVESETSFLNKAFIPYLVRILNNNASNPSTLLSMVDTFAHNEFYQADITQILNQGVESFGGGIGFGIQIYCNDTLIFDGGAGGGGGYNIEDKPNIFQFGSGGGIQINNISMGGGSGIERRQYKFDVNAKFKQFYNVEIQYFKQLFEVNAKCERIYVKSGGGSGGGFTVNNNTDLISWSYYDLNMIVE